MNQFPYQKRDFSLKIKNQQYPNPLPTQPQRSISELIESSIILINKPQGPTSHQVSAYARDIIGVDSCGHSGTLDPNVTGLLPVAVKNAKKVLQALLSAGKEYVCLMHLHKPIDKKTIQHTLSSFVGVITQMPPVKSAVKRQLRKREIYYLEVLEIDGQDVLFRVGCQAGTYIRKLCTDIGEKLGCGAHMQQLIRTRVADFGYTQSVTLQDITDAMYFYTQKQDESLLREILLPIETAVSHLPKIWIHNGAISPICHGAQLAIPGVLQFHACIKKNEMVAIMSEKGELVALAQTIMDMNQLYHEKKGVVCKTLRVTLNPKDYVHTKSE